jgi:hypothetical protein
MRHSRRNPVTVPLREAAILVVTGSIIGGVAYWLWSRSVAASASTGSGAIPTGSDAAGNATYAIPPSAATGGVGVFVNQTPGALGPTATSSAPYGGEL